MLWHSNFHSRCIDCCCFVVVNECGTVHEKPNSNDACAYTSMLLMHTLAQYFYIQLGNVQMHLACIGNISKLWENEAKQTVNRNIFNNITVAWEITASIAALFPSRQKQIACIRINHFINQIRIDAKCLIEEKTHTRGIFVSCWITRCKLISFHCDLHFYQWLLSCTTVSQWRVCWSWQKNQ